jgi:hypothetical protein
MCFDHHWHNKAAGTLGIAFPLGRGSKAWAILAGRLGDATGSGCARTGLNG